MKSRTKVFLIIIGLFLCICCGGPLLFWVKFTSGSTGLSAGIRDYKAAGLPWTASELQPPVPPDQDGGPQLLKAFAKTKSLVSSAYEQEIFHAVEDKQFGIAPKKLEPCQRYLDDVLAALHKPRVTFTKDWDLGPGVLFPELAESKLCAKLLCDRAVVRANLGDVKGSNLDLAGAWKLGEAAGAEPNLIGLLVQIADRSIAQRGVERCIPYELGNLDLLKALQATVNQMDERVDFRRSIRGEAYMNLNIVRNVSYYGSHLKELGGEGGDVPPIDKKELRRDGNPTGAYASLLGGPPLTASARLSRIADQDQNDPVKLAQDLNEFDKNIEAQSGVSSLLSKLLAPTFDGVGKAILHEISGVRTTKALLQALVMKDQTGHYPKSVTDLPTKWIDPADSEPLGMRVSGESIRFYAIGPDGIDHGGKTSAETGRTDQYDIVAGYPPPPHNSPSRRAKSL